MLQALLEYACFAPAGLESPASEAAKTRTFTAFWASGTPRVGEAGGRGWAAWAAETMDGAETASSFQPPLPHADDEELPPPPPPLPPPPLPPPPPLSPRGEEGPGGWSGWEEPPPPEEQSEREDEGRDDALFEPFVRAAVEEEEQAPRTHGEAAEGEGEREDEATERREVDMQAVDEQEEEEAEPTRAEAEEEEEPEETEAELLARLGLKLDEGLKGLGNQMTQQTFTRWVALEEARDREQWAPLRPGAGDGGDDEAAAALEREIDFDDVRDGLFSLPSVALRCAAAARCLALLRVPSAGASLPAWASAHPFLRSCVLSWAETPVAAAPLEALFAHPPPVPAWLAPDASAVASTAATAPVGAPEALWAHGTTERYRFVETLLTALLTAFPSHPLFLDASLAHAMRHPAAETTTTSTSSADPTDATAAAAPTATAATTALRYHALPGAAALNPQPPCAAASSSAAAAAVKATLAAHQGQPTLWTAYAWTEALRGKTASARRVLETVLAAVPTLSVAARRQAPVAWLAYAELELSVDAEDASGRAIHLLCGLVERGPFAPPPPPLKRTKGAVAAAAAADRSIDPRRLQTCRAAMQALLEAELRDAGGATPRTERGVAVVAAAALFAFLTVGVDAADAVYAQVSLLFRWPFGA